MQLHLRLIACILPLTLLAHPANAASITDDLDLGGALRGRLDYDPDRDISKFSFDTFFLTADYHSDTWIAAAKYRFYGDAYPYEYTDRVGDIAFAEYAWVGYRFSAQRQVQVGQTPIPFGLLPYFGSTFFETLGNVIGLEDTQDIGVKYLQNTDGWDLQAAYYPIPAEQGRGTSRGGRTYGTSVATADDYVADGSDNHERNILVGRLARKFEAGGWNSEIGASVLGSTLDNRDTDENGSRYAFALHYSGKRGPWGIQAQATRQQMNAKNPGTDELISFGSFDGTFNVAAKGNLYVADLSYDIPGRYGWLSGIKLYGNYSLFDKDESAFSDSQRLILGSSFSLGPLWIALEWLHGRNDPYIGGSDYTQSLGAGGTGHWENQLYSNIGYYF
ncbi:porin [Pseudomonas sp. JH-2]|uniref:porin n=1 Tax=Pseudomonas sp. JH-2 TaxID=3114998 RepID=UPI002E25246F|nr:porin [Pseudomonas sp. JH-2]